MLPYWDSHQFLDRSDARGLTELEERVEVALNEVRASPTLTQLEDAKDDMTNLIEQIPQDRRGAWFDKLGEAYKETKQTIKREEKRT